MHVATIPCICMSVSAYAHTSVCVFVYVSVWVCVGVWCVYKCMYLCQCLCVDGLSGVFCMCMCLCVMYSWICTCTHTGHYNLRRRQLTHTPSSIAKQTTSHLDSIIRKYRTWDQHPVTAKYFRSGDTRDQRQQKKKRKETPKRTKRRSTNWATQNVRNFVN